jgi:TPR repeat protein
MKLQPRQLVLLVAFGTILAPALLAQVTGDQAASSQPAGIDPALLAKANAGDAPSQVLVGESYAAGKGVARDYNVAANWYLKAAQKGDIPAEMHLAILFRDGGGKAFPRDMVQAADWYRKAAEQGDVTAQGILGTLYSMGQGVRQSYPDAYFWLDVAAHATGPNQEKYAANRQSVGTNITADELADVQERVAKWLAAHPH